MPRTRPYDSPLWPPLRLKVLERDGHLCQIKGPGCTVLATVVDHIVPWGDGGSWFGYHDDIDHPDNNLRGGCSSCNSKRAKRAVKRRPSREW